MEGISVPNMFKQISIAFVETIGEIYNKENTGIFPKDPYIKTIIKKKRILYLLVLLLILYLIAQFIFSY